MEQVWLGEFANLFQSYRPHQWSLFPVHSAPIGLWNQFVDSAKVRFSCLECGHGWTSMKGRIAYWFVQASNGEGFIAFKLYGQQCDKCKSGRFQSAMWYPEEVVKVLVNLYNRVGQVYYGFIEPPIQKTRRAGKPRTPHNASLCQACYDGVCTEQNRLT
ncbi:receptor-transporting protein 3 [Galendromus occidentalis]|uniref:Receptor-transporting protein 3 n=1 Tax=Galendromus occidentalis TaxID=34638 RepID=A0AAJ6VW26_9ACAR|nr:receptor-transporting protein 3 [Galendromus occidentalis]